MKERPFPVSLDGSELKYLMNAAGVTQAELGKLVHRTERTVSDWIGDRRAINASMERLIREALERPSETRPLQHVSDFLLLSELEYRLAQARSVNPSMVDKKTTDWKNVRPN